MCAWASQSFLEEQPVVVSSVAAILDVDSCTYFVVYRTVILGILVSYVRIYRALTTLCVTVISEKVSYLM